MLGYRPGDTDHVCFLKSVVADQGGGHLTGNDDHGNGIHVGRRDTGNGVGRSRTAGRNGDTDFTCGSGVTVGSVNGSLLMSGKNMTNGGTHQIVINVDNSSSGVAKYCVNPFKLQTFQKNL